jgi:hypothetical protein
MIQTNAAFLAAPNAFSNHKTCVSKRSIPDWGHTVHRYLLEAKAKNTIKLSHHEDKPWLLGCFSKDLIIITQPKPTKKKPLQRMLRHRTSHVLFHKKNSSRQKTKASCLHAKVHCCHLLQEDHAIYNQIVIKAIVMYYPPGHSQLHHQL